MARPGRPSSEHFQSGHCRVTSSREDGMEEKGDEEDRAPIFSLSKSSMDVLMAAGPPHMRDPAWTRLDLRRSSSTNTHSVQNSLTLQQLHARTSQQPTHTAQHTLIHSPPPPGEGWIANVERWSVCSESALSGSSTPETVVWKEETVRPWSLTQETPCSTPDSPMSKIASPPTIPSPYISPLQTPTLPYTNAYLPSPLTLSLSTHQQEDTLIPLSTTSPLLSPLQDHTTSPLLSPLQAHTSSPLPPSPLPSNSPELLQLTSTEDEYFLQNHILSFPFPSPIPSAISLEGGGGFESVSPEPECLFDDVAERLSSLTFSSGSTQSLGVGKGSPVDVQMSKSSKPLVEVQESRGGASVCHLELEWQPGQRCPTNSFPCRGCRLPLVSSLSDSRLGDCCRCNSNRSGLEITALKASPWAPKGELFRENRAMTLEEGTMTSQLELVDVAVQTVSPAGSWWNLRRNMSHSILGSPPGSRLNLRSSLGSNSNLVSLSSSMFPSDSGEEEGQGDDLMWAVNSPSSHPLERRRSCLKVQREERWRSRETDELGRRSSMKQVQWDEEGMTWDVHGASLDPEELSTAIQRHLELQSNKDRNSPRPQKHKSKKKMATKAAETPPIANTAKVMVPEPSPPLMVDMATSMMESDSEVRPEAGGERELEKERSTKEEKANIVSGTSKVKREKKDDEGEVEEVHGEEGTLHHTASPRGSGRSQKKSMIRSLKRTGWCGGCRKAND